MKNLVLLDYDGYIAKSFYAGVNADDPANFEECYKSLRNMEGYAIEKSARFFNCREKDLKVLKVVSGHTFKKDIYPSYKGNRKPDELLGMYRDEIKGEFYKELIVYPLLEADDILIMINELYHQNSIVFSDDKDLHKYCRYTCGLNEHKEINDLKYGFQNQLVQLAAGDTIDNIKGCPNYGEKKTETYLKRNGFTIENIVSLYLTNGVNLDDCTKNLILIHPFSKGCLKDVSIEHQKNIVNTILTNPEYEQEGFEEMYNQIREVIFSISSLVKEVYKSEQQKQSQNK